MKITMKRELPGDVLFWFRTDTGHARSAKVFAELAGFTYSTLHRLESIRWGVDESKWQAHFDIIDLDYFINAKMMKKGDEWYQRFERAFKWQRKVMCYGSIVYQGVDLDTSDHAPVLDEHLLAVIHVVMGKMVAELGPAHPLDEAASAQAEQKLYLAVRSALEAVSLLATGAAGEEVSRGLLYGLTGTGDLHDTPYVRTLRFAVQYASVFARERWEDLVTPESQS